MRMAKKKKISRHQIFTYFDEGKKLMIAKENSINKASSRLLSEKYYISFMANNMSQPKESIEIEPKSIFSPISSLTVFLKFRLFTERRQKRGKIDNF